MKEEFSRLALLIGENALNLLATKKVAIFGLGGVGSYVAEALARSGIGSFELIDKDVVDVSNRNRQLCALNSTVGESKTEVVKARILDINPTAEVVTRKIFFLPDTAAEFDFGQYDYVVDAIDTVTAKCELIKATKKAGTPIISAMSAGNRFDATALRVADIYDTDVCPLCRIMRKELKALGIPSLKVVYSTEKGAVPLIPSRENGKQIIGSTAWVPSVMGLIMAGEVVKELING